MVFSRIAGISVRGVGSRLRCQVNIIHPGVLRRIGFAHDFNSLSRGTRCRTTGHRHNGGRDQVECLEGVVGATVIVSSDDGTSRIKLFSAMDFCVRRSSYARDIQVIAALHRGSVRNVVDGRSPLNSTLVNGGIGSHMCVGMGSDCNCCVMVGAVRGNRSSEDLRVEGFWDGRPADQILFVYVFSLDCYLRRTRHQLLVQTWWLSSKGIYLD